MISSNLLRWCMSYMQKTECGIDLMLMEQSGKGEAARVFRW